ncbi:MAG: DUF4038 domain-containing protein [Leadbetterella sp.]
MGKWIKICSLYFFFLFIGIHGFTQKTRSPFILNSVYNTPRYQPIDIVFVVSKAITDNPFDHTFGAKFVCSGKSNFEIQGFYNGNNEYVIRFCPEDLGEYSFTTFSNVASLVGLKAKIECVPNNNLECKPPIIVDPTRSKQKFSYKDGKSYFANAFEIDWLFSLDMDNSDDIPKTKEMVASIKQNGFNQVVMNVYAYDKPWYSDSLTPAKYIFSKPSYSVFKGDNRAPDFEYLNTDYFKKLDRTIQCLHENGIVAHIMIYVWNKKVNWPPMYSQADNRYFDYVIKRYQAYSNVIWDVSKEALDYGRCDIDYINERIARIHRLDTYNRLVTVHDYEYCSREPDKVDFISIQNWRSDLYSLSLEAYQKHSNMPVMNIEHGGYEKGPFVSFQGNYVDPKVCLERNYACIFSGLYGCYYWQDTSWDIIIYDIMNSSNNLAKPKFEYYKYLQELFTKYDFNKLHPFKQKLTTNSRLGNDNFATSGYSLTDNQGMYMFFLPKENFLLNLVLPNPNNSKFDFTWFNIFSGESIIQKNTDYYMFKSMKSPWQGESAVLIAEEVKTK